MKPISFQSCLLCFKVSFRFCYLPLLHASVFSVPCLLISTATLVLFPSPSSLGLDSLTSFSWVFSSLLLLPTHLAGRYKLSIKQQTGQICADKADSSRNKVVWSPKKLHHCTLPSDSVTKCPPQNQPLSKSQMASVRDVVPGWKVESMISKVTVATELIIVKLLNSPWPCGAQLL